MPNIIVSLKFHGDSEKASLDVARIIRSFHPLLSGDEPFRLTDPELRQKIAALRLRADCGPDLLPVFLTSDETEFSIEDSGHISIRDCFLAFADALRRIMAHNGCVSQISGTVLVRERSDCLIFAANCENYACSEWLAKKTRAMMRFPF